MLNNFIKKTNNKTVFVKILISFLALILFFFIITYGLCVFFSNQMKKNAIKEYTQTLEFVSNYANQSINQALTGVDILRIQPDIYSVFYSINNDDLKNIYKDVSKVDRINTSLLEFKNTHEYLCGVTIVDRVNGIVYSDKGNSTISAYFDKGAVYSDYNGDFWKSMEIPGVGYRVLNPTMRNDIHRTVIPLVAGGFRGVKTNQLIILDLDSDAVLNIFNQSNVAIGSNIFIFNPNTDVVIGQNSSDSLQNVFKEKKFLDLLNDTTSFTYKYQGDNYLVVNVKGNISTLSYNFVSMVRLDSLLKSFNNMIHVIIVICIILLAILVFVAYNQSLKIYSPIRNIKSQISKLMPETGNAIETDEMEFLRNGINYIASMNSMMSQRIKRMVPLVCEQKFLNYLNSNEEKPDEELEYLLHQAGIDFHENGFITAFIKFDYSERFYEDFSKEQYGLIDSGLDAYYKELISSKYTSFVISGEHDNVVIIINTPEDEQYPYDIYERLKYSLKSFKEDEQYLHVKIALSRMFSGYKGMRESYHESKRMSTLQAGVNKTQISIYNDESRQVNRYVYTIDDENKLFHSIVRGNVELAEQSMDMILEQNIGSDISSANINSLYGQIYNTIIKALDSKKVSEETVMQDEYIGSDMLFNGTEEEERVEYIIKLLKKATAYSKLSATKLDMDGIVAYIDAHFDEDIFLETIAEKFNTTSKYLSKMLKQKLGVGFSEYLARMRIEKAKKLLVETDMKINEIYTNCGFYSRNTFIRTFKNYVGVLPSDYRNMSASNKVKTP